MGDLNASDGKGSTSTIRFALTAPLNLMIVSNALLMMLIVVSIYLQSSSFNFLVDRQNNQVVRSTLLIKELVKLEWRRKSLLQSTWTAASVDELSARLDQLTHQNQRIAEVFNQLFDPQFEPAHMLTVRDPYKFRFAPDVLALLAEQGAAPALLDALNTLAPTQDMTMDELLAHLDTAGVSLSRVEAQRLFTHARREITLLEMLQVSEDSSLALNELTHQLSSIASRHLDDRERYRDVSRQALAQSLEVVTELMAYPPVNTERLYRSVIALVLSDTAGQARAAVHRLRRTVERSKRLVNQQPYAAEAVARLDALVLIAVSGAETFVSIADRQDMHAFYSDQLEREHALMVGMIDVIAERLFNEQKLSASALLSSAEQFRWLITIFGLLAIAMSVTFGWSTRRSIVNPLMMMSSKASRLAEGDLHVDGPLDEVAHRRDEVGVLARSLVQMTHALAEQKQAIASQQQALERMAFFDCLTGLPNRAHFRKILDQTLRHARQHGQMSAVMFIDLDGFKRINDTFGHDIGDQLLKVVSQRLSDCLRASDCVTRVYEHEFFSQAEHDAFSSVARLGGDEFTVVLHHLAGAEDAAHIATRILEALAHPVSLCDQAVTVTPSIGIEVFPRADESIEDILKRADMAMYQAKQRGKNQYVFFNPEFDYGQETSVQENGP